MVISPTKDWIQQKSAFYVPSNEELMAWLSSLATNDGCADDDEEKYHAFFNGILGQLQGYNIKDASPVTLDRQSTHGEEYLEP